MSLHEKFRNLLTYRNCLTACTCRLHVCTYVYIYVYMYVWTCLCVRACVRTYVRTYGAIARLKCSFFVRFLLKYNEMLTSHLILQDATSQDSVFMVMTRVRPGQTMNSGSTPGRNKSKTLTTHLQIVPSLRMSAAIHVPLPRCRHGGHTDNLHLFLFMVLYTYAIRKLILHACNDARVRLWRNVTR
jgi:hypothetical protein